jgi:hypothetical protein
MYCVELKFRYVLVNAIYGYFRWGSHLLAVADGGLIVRTEASCIYGLRLL